MAVYYYPFESHETGDESNPYDRAITAEQERMFNKLRYVNGVFNPDGGALRVTSNSNMTVTVGTGGCHIEGAIAYNDAPITLPIEAANATLNRIDRVVAQFNTSDSVRAINFIVRTGTAATNPIAPELRKESNLYEIALADIYVGKNVSSIGTANITDLRLNSDLCGFVVPAIPTPLDLSGIYNQYQASLNEWLDTVAAALDGTLAGNLQSQITDLDTRMTTEEGKIQPILLGGTGASDKLGAANSLEVYSLAGHTNIPANSDLNDYTTPGNYCVGTAANVPTIANCPVSSNNTFYMKVGKQYTPSSSYIYQEVTLASKFVIYHRRFSGSTWSDWVMSLNENNGIQIKKVWENASPTSEFAEQKMKINGISKYQMVLLFARESTTATAVTMTFARIGETTRLRQFFNYRQIRNFDYNTLDEVWFSNGMEANYNANLAISNKSVIPIAMYGVKGVA